MNSKFDIKLLISLIGMLLIGVAGGWTINLAVSSPENVVEMKIEPEVDSSLTLSENQLDSPIEISENGEKKVVDTVTVDEVDGGELPFEFDGKTNEELNLGRGAYYDASTPESWLDSTYGKCIDLDGYFGSQCVDYFAAYTVQECGFWPSTNGTGAAYGIWDAREYNAHDGCFRLIYDKYNLKVGAYVDFYGGLYGHIGVFLGYVDDNHILLAGENQGGPACEGGGAAVNVITISLDQFRGAFIPTKWDFPEDEPEPEQAVPFTNCIQWHLEQGDTMSRIMLECENTVVYGEAMDAYAKTWYSIIYAPGQSVYDGWYKSQNGVGLYAGDDIEHRVGDN